MSLSSVITYHFLKSCIFHLYTKAVNHPTLLQTDYIFEDEHGNDNDVGLRMVVTTAFGDDILDLR